MQVTQNEIDPTTLQFEFEIEPEKVKRAFDRAIKQLSRDLRIPGFRPGQAPRQVIEQFLPEAEIKEEAVRILVRESLGQVLQDRNIVPYGSPDYDIESIEEDEPFLYRATVPLPPQIELGEYKSMRAQATPQTVQPEELEHALHDLCLQLTTYQKIEGRGAQADDRAGITLRSLEDEEHEGQRYLVVVGRSFGELDNALAGMKPGETKTATITFPNDFEDETLAGQMCNVEINLQELFEAVVPELDDELAKKINFENVEALKAHAEHAILTEKHRLERQRIENALITQLREQSTVQLPKTLIDQQVEDDITEFREHLLEQGSSLTEYALQNGMSEETLTAELRKQSIIKLENSFILMEIAKKEKIEVKESVITAEIDRIGREAGYKPVDIQRAQQDKDIRARMRAQIQIDYAMALLAGNALAQTTVEGSETNAND
jgi:trigger factor